MNTFINTIRPKDGYTTLHYACKYRATTEVITKMIDVGGRELVMEKNKGGYDTASYYACRNET